MMAAQTPRRVVARLEPLSAEAKLAPLRQLLEDGSITPEVYARARSKLDAAATPQPEPQPEPERGAEEEGSGGGGGGGARKERAASPPLEPSREEWTAMLQPSPAALAEGNSPSEVSSYDTALTADSNDPQMLAAEARTAAFVSEAAVEATLQGATERLEAELALQQPRQGPEEGAAVPAEGLRFNHTPQEAAAAAAARRREQHDAVLAALAAREAALAQREDAADRREAAIEQRETELEAAAAALAEERALHEQEVAALASRAEALRSEGEAVGASAAELRLAERGVREAEGALVARREALSQREQELLSEDFALNERAAGLAALQSQLQLTLSAAASPAPTAPALLEAEGKDAVRLAAEEPVAEAEDGEGLGAEVEVLRRRMEQADRLRRTESGAAERTQLQVEGGAPGGAEELAMPSMASPSLASPASPWASEAQSMDLGLALLETRLPPSPYEDSTESDEEREEEEDAEAAAAARGAVVAATMAEQGGARLEQLGRLQRDLAERAADTRRALYMLS